MSGQEACGRIIDEILEESDRSRVRSTIQELSGGEDLFSWARSYMESKATVISGGDRHQKAVFAVAWNIWHMYHPKCYRQTKPKSKPKSFEEVMNFFSRVTPYVLVTKMYKPDPRTKHNLLSEIEELKAQLASQAK